MIFNELAYLIFLPSVVALHFLMPHRWRWALLLGASYFFYMWWNPLYAVLILTATLVAYCAGIGMDRSSRQAERAEGGGRTGRARWLVFSLVCNLGLLFAFKYFNFFARSTNAVLGWLEQPYALPSLDVLLPIGISFYTFQTLSYTIEVYRGRQTPERHFGIFALYVSFFPQLVAGPIERAGNLLPQFREEHRFDPQLLREGLFLVLWGTFKKVVLADLLAREVNRVYAGVDIYPGPRLALATLAFALQIYYDFSGYSDIAIGSARILGYRLMKNFNGPYAAKSIPEFWSRWHISLSTWFRDFVYIPLGGSRVRTARWVTNILIVFVVSGLWHGASWTFAIWGTIHGAFYLAHAGWKPLRDGFKRRTRLERVPWLYDRLASYLTLGIVCFAWIFFRADSLSTAWTVVRRLGPGWSAGNVVTFVLLLEIMRLLHSGTRLVEGVPRRVWWVRWPVYVGVTILILNLGVVRDIPFIYFQF